MAGLYLAHTMKDVVDLNRGVGYNMTRVPALYYYLFSPDGRINLGTPVRRLPNIAPGSYTLALDGGPAKAFQVMEGGVTVVELP